MTKHLQTWVQHVKDYANAHNMKYGQALKSSECRNSYKKGSTNDEVVNEVKPKRKYTRRDKNLTFKKTNPSRNLIIKIE